MDIILREFGRYVLDSQRTKLFTRAIREVVRQKDIVVDLGTGFGLLAMIAVKCGAERVYAIEQGDYLELARAIARDNGLDARIEWVHGNSCLVNLPERADVIISETIGHFALEEYLVEYLYDAKRRFLKKSGTIVPQKIKLWLIPVEIQHFACTDDWHNIEGFDLSRLFQTVKANEYTAYQVGPITEPYHILGPPTLVSQFVLGLDKHGKFLNTVRCQCNRSGQLNALIGYFEAQLSSSVELSTHPDEPETHWNHVIFQLELPSEIEKGSTIALTICFHKGARWSLEVNVDK